MERKWRVLTNTTIGTFMALLDSSIVLISLPTIGRELPQTSPETLLWIVLSYSLVTATLLLTFGRLSDMFGRVRLYTLGFAIFTIGSAFCSLATDGNILLAARVVEGIGAGFLAANGAAIVTDAFPIHERGKALGINQVSALAGSMMGLVLGGVLTSLLGWRSIFWVNIPVGIVGTVWAYVGLEEVAAREIESEIDWVGNVLFSGGITALLAGVTLGGLVGWYDPMILLLLFGGLGMIVVFVFVEQVVRSPMFDFHLLRIRTFVMGNLAAFFSALARGSFTFILVFYFQGILLLSAFNAGVMLLPLSAAFIIVGPLSGVISDRRGSKLLGTTGLLVSAIGFAILLEFRASDPYWMLAVSMVFLGVGQGMFGSPNRAEVMSSVPPSRRGVASAFTTMFLNAGSMGSLAVGFTILAATVPRSTLAVIFAGLTPSSPLDVNGFMGAVHTIFIAGLALTLVAAASNALRGREARAWTAGDIAADSGESHRKTRGGGSAEAK